MKHNFYIYNSGGEYRVRPTMTELDKNPGNNTITPLIVRNATNEPVVLVFPKDSIVQSATQVGDWVSVDVQKKKTINFIGATTPLSFSFSVCVITKDGGMVKAKAESDPIIIIDD